MWTWQELAGASLARQFPAAPLPVIDLCAAVGPIQSQTARSPYVGLAARQPGLTHAELTAAYEAGMIVRGSSIRGTVHTSTYDDHRLLAAATKASMRGLLSRNLFISDDEIETLSAVLEDFAGDWRTVDELREVLFDWVEQQHGPAHRARAEAETGSRYVAFAGGYMIRRPAKGSWSGQGAALYRTVGHADDPLDDWATALVRRHLACHGPASRHDLAWWSGLGLNVIDEVLASLSLASALGPDGRTYVDLPSMPAPRELSGVRLLPEFDSLLCAYDPKARDRFVTWEHQQALRNSANGLFAPALLVDGRITGMWRSTGSARKRPLEVHWFAGTRKPRVSELDSAVAALATGLDIEITSVSVTRAG